MGNTLSPWAIGANVLVKIQALTKSDTDYSLVNATGVAEQSFRGKIQSYGDDYSLHSSDLTPMDSFLDNPVIYGATGTYTITEFESPVNTLGGGSVRVSVLRYMLATSFYHKLTIQLGTVASGTFTATNTETAYVQFMSNAKNASRESVMRSAQFQLIQVSDSSTGLYVTNPAFS